MIDKNLEYTERHKEWRNIAVTQLSTTNNVLLTLSSGFFVFCIDKATFKKVAFGIHNIHWGYTFYVLSIFLLMISILFGILVLFSRLYDFKISRHLAMTRKRAYSNGGVKLPDFEIENPTLRDRLAALWIVIFSELHFIEKADAGERRVAKFYNLRRLSHILGIASWRWTKVQVLTFFVGVLLYFTYLFLQ